MGSAADVEPSLLLPAVARARPRAVLLFSRRRAESWRSGHWERLTSLYPSISSSSRAAGCCTEVDGVPRRLETELVREIESVRTSSSRAVAWNS